MVIQSNYRLDVTPFYPSSGGPVHIPIDPDYKDQMSKLPLSERVKPYSRAGLHFPVARVVESPPGGGLRFNHLFSLKDVLNKEIPPETKRKIRTFDIFTLSPDSTVFTFQTSVADKVNTTFIKALANANRPDFPPEERARWQRRLAECYLKGEGIKKDLEQAIYWLRKAADGGNSRARRILGDFYLEGRGLPKDEAVAVTWYLKAAAQGNSEAEKNLGHCYREGRGVVQNATEAVKWYHRAAERQNTEAEKSLGDCYLRGEGVEKDLRQAIEWYCKASHLGNHAGAHHQLALFYERGEGVEFNPFLAFAYMSLAAEQQFEPALLKLQEYGKNGEKIPGLKVNPPELPDLKLDISSEFFSLTKETVRILPKHVEGYSAKKPTHLVRIKWIEPTSQEHCEKLFTLEHFNKRYQSTPGQGLCKFTQVKGVQKVEVFALSDTENDIYSSMMTQPGPIYNLPSTMLEAVEKAHHSELPPQELSYWQVQLGSIYASDPTLRPEGPIQAVKWYQKAADRGDRAAQYRLGCCYKNGHGVESSEEQAFIWYKKSAEQGYSIAQFELGTCYEQGTGVAKDEAEAAKWYQLSATQGNPDAQYRLGFCYDKGRGVPKDEAEAVKWWRKAAEEGWHAKAMGMLGSCYEHGKGGLVQDSAKAVTYYEKAIRGGDVLARFRLGAYYESVGDFAKAAEHYEFAAAAKHPKALNNLGRLFLEGLGVPQDENRSVALFAEAVELKVVSALHNLGICYLKGLGGLPKDEKRAAELFQKAADQGDMKSQNSLAQLFLDGRGVAQDVGKAFIWFHKAAEQGDASAQYRVGRYLKQKGDRASEILALSWFQEAAKQGHKGACYELGLCYEAEEREEEAFVEFLKSAEQGVKEAQLKVARCYANGTGTAQDDAQAFIWYQKAADQGVPAARESLAVCYEKGLGTDPNAERAEELRKQVAGLPQQEAGAQPSSKRVKKNPE